MSTVVEAGALRETAEGIFAALGFAPPAGRQIAGSLVDADLRGVHSHGVMLLPLYADRVRRGLVTTADGGRVAHDAGAVAIVDGERAAGQLVAHQAMELAVRKARAHGIGAVGVRRSNHFGAAAAYAVQAAEAGCIGIATSNTTPLMPPPGGAEAIVGNNPLAVAVPGAEGPEIVLDIALSAVAGGKLRYAAHAGEAIPATWATDADGVPTTDPAAGLQGMLLPVGGHKGFGLALVVDVLCGVLAGGEWGPGVRSIYRELSAPNDCGHFLLALDVAHFRERAGFDADIADLARAVRGARRAPGVDRLYVPGEIEAEAAERASAAGLELEDEVLDAVLELAEELGVRAAVPARSR